MSWLSEEIEDDGLTLPRREWFIISVVALALTLIPLAIVLGRGLLVLLLCVGLAFWALCGLILCLTSLGVALRSKSKK